MWWKSMQEKQILAELHSYFSDIQPHIQYFVGFYYSIVVAQAFLVHSGWILFLNITELCDFIRNYVLWHLLFSWLKAWNNCCMLNISVLFLCGMSILWITFGTYVFKLPLSCLVSVSDPIPPSCPFLCWFCSYEPQVLLALPSLCCLLKLC